MAMTYFVPAVLVATTLRLQGFAGVRGSLLPLSPFAQLVRGDQGEASLACPHIVRVSHECRGD